MPNNTAASFQQTAGEDASGGSLARSTPPTGMNQIDARPHLEGGSAYSTKTSAASGIFSALAQSTIPVWAQTAVMVALIFGGCCSNVG
jgi:UDP-xylose/UDP-N-acetylglucosamine transporter B4